MIATCNDGVGCNDVSRSVCHVFDAIKYKCPHKCETCTCQDLKANEHCKTVKRNKMCKDHPLSKVFGEGCAKTCEICGQTPDDVKPQCQNR